MTKKEFLEEFKGLLKMAEYDVNFDYKVWPEERYSIILDVFEVLLNQVEQELDYERK